MPHCSADLSLSPLTFVFKVAQHIQLGLFFIAAHIRPSHSLKPVVFSTLHWHKHRVHLSNYIHVGADVLWQSYKALMSLFLINQILPERNFSSSGFKRYSC